METAYIVHMFHFGTIFGGNNLTTKGLISGVLASQLASDCMKSNILK
jgi:hypothetical protein